MNKNTNFNINFNFNNNSQDSLKNFKSMPMDGNFNHLQNSEIISYSEYLISYFNDLTTDDVYYFIDQGVLDFKKAETLLLARKKIS